MRFLFTCGGTAGHINPALAIAGRLEELLGHCEILFIGAKGMMETELVPREGYEIREIDITNISRSLSLEGFAHNLVTVKNVAVSIERAKKIMKEFLENNGVECHFSTASKVQRAMKAIGK